MFPFTMTDTYTHTHTHMHTDHIDMLIHICISEALYVHVNIRRHANTPTVKCTNAKT